METLKQELGPMKFAKVVGGKKLKGSGLTNGDEVLVVATKDVAFKKNDPYLKRTLMVTARIEDGIPMLPKEGTDHKVIVVDPRSLELVSEEREKVLLENLNTKYS